MPVIAISHEPWARAAPRPQMSDLRESGSIEQDADMVILLHRDKSDRPASEAGRDRRQAPKRPHQGHRSAFQGHYSRFANMANDFG